MVTIPVTRHPPADRLLTNLRTPQISQEIGGGRGIRTPGTVPGTAVFKTAAFNRSAIPPARSIYGFRQDCSRNAPTRPQGRSCGRVTSGSITSSPRMYGLSTGGTATVPSFRW